jgi:hypothetical protein
LLVRVATLESVQGGRRRLDLEQGGEGKEIDFVAPRRSERRHETHVGESRRVAHAKSAPVRSLERLEGAEPVFESVLGERERRGVSRKPADLTEHTRIVKRLRPRVDDLDGLAHPRAEERIFWEEARLRMRRFEVLEDRDRLRKTENLSSLGPLEDRNLSEGVHRTEAVRVLFPA